MRKIFLIIMCMSLLAIGATAFAEDDELLPAKDIKTLGLDDNGNVNNGSDWDTDTYGTEKYNPASPSYQDPNGSFGTEIQKKKRPSQDWKKSARQIESEKEAERKADIERAIWESNHPGSAFCFINSLMD